MVKFENRLIFEKGDYIGLRKHIEGGDVNYLYENWIEIYQEGVIKFIPTNRCSNVQKITKQNPKWFNANLKKLTNRKYELHMMMRSKTLNKNFSFSVSKEIQFLILKNLKILF